MQDSGLANSPLATPVFTQPQVEMWNCENKRQCYISGRRLGKTHMLLYRELDLAIRMPGSRIWHIGPSFPLIKPMAERLTAWLRAKDVLSHHNRQDNIWTTINGGMIQFKSADDPESLRGWDCDLVILDEASLCKEGALHNSIIATSVRDGTLIISMNVPEPDHLGYEWAMKLIYDWQRDPTKDVFIYPSWENEYVYPEGRQDPKILELEATLPPDVFARRIGADLRVLTGLVYPEFDPVRHVVPDITPGKCAVSIDPAYKNVASVHFYDFDGKTLTAFDEVYRSHLTDPDIVAIVAGYPIRPEFAVYDAEDAGLGAMLIEAGIPAIPADKRSVHEGIMVTKTWFHQGRIRICHRCEKMRWELSKYAFHKSSETPIKVNDHACDDLRYMVTQLDNSEKRQAEQAIHIREELPRIELGQEPSHVWA